MFFSSEHKSDIEAMISDSDSSEQSEDEVTLMRPQRNKKDHQKEVGDYPSRGQQGIGEGVGEGVILPLHLQLHLHLQVEVTRILIHQIRFPLLPQGDHLDCI